MFIGVGGDGATIGHSLSLTIGKEFTTTPVSAGDIVLALLALATLLLFSVAVVHSNNPNGGNVVTSSSA